MESESPRRFKTICFVAEEARSNGGDSYFEDFAGQRVLRNARDARVSLDEILYRWVHVDEFAGRAAPGTVTLPPRSWVLIASAFEKSAA